MRDKKEKMLKPFGAYWTIKLFIGLHLLLLTSSAAYAHSVYLFAWAEGDTIYTESYFGDDKKVNDGLIIVFDPSGKEILRGKTNEMGEFSFKIPQKTDMRIVLESSMGHGAEYIFKVDEFSDTVENTEEKPEIMEPNGSSSSVQDMDTKQIRVMIEEILDSRLKPIARDLAMLQQKRGPGLTEIIGGIGYIFGIMGIVLYFKARKK